MSDVKKMTYHCSTEGDGESYEVEATSSYLAAVQHIEDCSLSYEQSQTYTVAVTDAGGDHCTHDIAVHPDMPDGVTGDTEWAQVSVVGSQHGKVSIMEVSYLGIMRITDRGATRSHDGRCVTTVVYRPSVFGPEKQAVVGAENLQELCDALNAAEEYVCNDDKGLDLMGLMDLGMDIGNLRSFGGGPPPCGSEYISWDETSILVMTEDGEFGILPREISA